MQRRDFLKALAIVATMPIDAQASTVWAVSPAIPVIHPYQKFIDALALYDEVIAANDEYRNALKASPLDTSNQPVLESANVFIAFVLANFKQPYRRDDPEFESEAIQVRAVIDHKKSNGEQCHDLIRSVPPKVAEVAWAVAAIKSLLNEHRIPLNTGHCPNFGVFACEYKEIVIS